MPASDSCSRFVFMPQTALKFRGQRQADGARLNDRDFTRRARRAGRNVAADAALISQIFAVERDAVVRVVKTDTGLEGVVARQVQLPARGRAREVGAPRAYITPGGADESLEIGKQVPVVFAVERSPPLRGIGQRIAGIAVDRRCGRGQ